MTNRLDFDNQFHNIEQVDLLTLEKILPQFYKPTDSPCCMCVGVLMLHEARLMKYFHHNVYGAPVESTKVAGVSNRNLPESPLLDVYDYKQFHELFGDARQDPTWAFSLNELCQDREKYDLAYIRNPELFSSTIRDHVLMFARALTWTSTQGAVVTMIRETDSNNYEIFLRELQQATGVKPVFSEKIDLAGIKSLHGRMFHGEIGIFKPTGEIY